ncbi:glycosyltransferase [Streptomyces millisiae]|uniref:Glycosyltransferase n=1 Tax=Streptomyces millisiae TaxID=3075542 RepID=A0ABU2LJ58_9ACTN|nr:glycosyltransferase [Streptomyces sp. DSM 44918]MDT0317617.1 glycosyltransferase [Streptomyces sp. DSM 44918]
MTTVPVTGSPPPPPPGTGRAPRRVVVAATPLHGHVTPLLTVAADLVARGHHVTVLTGARFAGRATALGARFVPLPAEADYDDRAMAAGFPGFAELRPGLAMDAFYLRRVFTDAAPGQWRGLRALLARHRADAVVADMLFLGALPLVLGAARPGPRPRLVALGVLPPMALSADAPPYGSGRPPARGPRAHRTHRAQGALVRSRLAAAQAHAERVFAGLGAPLPGFLYDLTVTAPDVYLQLTVPEFEYPRRDLPASFRFAGPLPPATVAGFAPPDWWPRLAEGRPVVVVTQGTLANADLTDLVVPTLRGLAGRRPLVIAATGRPDGPAEVRRALGGLPENAVVAAYVPFDRLLPHAAALVTNGGYGGTHAALAHGVPLVVAGATEDKPEVAARVAWSGAGLDLRTARPGARALRHAVQRVLTDGRHRRAARRLRDAARRHDPHLAIAEAVEDSPDKS